MSTFDGAIEGFEFLAVDRFDNLNCDVKLLFLSHCHYDHMVGLFGISGTKQPGPLYLSEISSIVIKKRLPAITNLAILKIGGEFLDSILFECFGFFIGNHFVFQMQPKLM